MLRQHNLLDIAYKKGVAMGGDLKTHDGTSSPSFAVWAMKDPEGANLDRIQIVKGWVNEQGESAERIYNIALSNQRLADPVSGDIAPVGNTVDANTGSYDNSIGDVKLAAFWRDPDFDPRQQAFYYARVLKIPTPRDGLPSMHSSSDSNRHNRSAYKNVQSPLQSGTNRSMKSPLARNDT